MEKVNAINTADTSSFFKKANYDRKIREIEKKLLIMIIINTLLLNNFAARLKQAN